MRQEVERVIPGFGSSLNPVDMTAQVINDPEGFKKLLALMEESTEVDMILTVISMITGDSGLRMAKDLADAYETGKKPVACCWLIDDEHGREFRELLSSRGVPVFSSLRRAASGLSMLAAWERRPALASSEPCQEWTPRLQALEGDLTEAEAKALLDSYGVPITRERLCRSLSESIAAAEEIGYPVALKVMSPDILHKTEAGIVALRVRDEEELRNTYGRILEKAEKFRPGARVRGVLVQEMVSGGQECIVGVRRDPVFGPVVAVGLGGIFVEVLKDVSLRLAPVDRQTVLSMLQELEGLPLLQGARGPPPRDVEALVSLVHRLEAALGARPGLTRRQPRHGPGKVMRGGGRSLTWERPAWNGCGRLRGTLAVQSRRVPACPGWATDIRESGREHRGHECREDSRETLGSVRRAVRHGQGGTRRPVRPRFGREFALGSRSDRPRGGGGTQLPRLASLFQRERRGDVVRCPFLPRPAGHIDRRSAGPCLSRARAHLAVVMLSLVIVC